MSDESKFGPADLNEFHRGGLLWAVNQYVLWPLGYALTMTINEDGSIDPAIGISEWHAPDGHVETIESESTMNFPGDFDRWEAFRDMIVERIVKMPQVERDAAIKRLAPLQTSERPRWHWIDDDA